MVEIPISRATRRRFDKARLPGETDEQTAARLLDSAISSGRDSGFRVPKQINVPDPARILGLHKENPEHAKRIRAFSDVGASEAALPRQISGHLNEKEKMNEAAEAIFSRLTDQHSLPEFIREASGQMFETRDPDERRRIAQVLRLTTREHLNLYGSPKAADALNKIAELERRLAASDDLERMNNAPEPRLQRLAETGFHKCVESFRKGDVIYPGEDGKPIKTESGRPLAEMFAGGDLDFATFVIEHDWAAAFSKAQDFDEGEFRIPYEDVVFEFRISGHRVCAVTSTEDYLPAQVILMVETSVGWVLASCYRFAGGQWIAEDLKKPDLMVPVLNLVRSQIRAVCIALEAEVAQTEVVRAPHKLNAKREKAGKQPIFDYHVVQLARRTRVAPRLPDELDPNREIHHKRMHFVRGHWRHYEASKTWIKWHVRGDPDLGFIDKEYRL